MTRLQVVAGILLYTWGKLENALSISGKFGNLHALLLLLKKTFNTHDGSSLSVFSVVVETGDDIFDIIQRHGGNGVFPGVDSE